MTRAPEPSLDARYPTALRGTHRTRHRLTSFGRPETRRRRRRQPAHTRKSTLVLDWNIVNRIFNERHTRPMPKPSPRSPRQWKESDLSPRWQPARAQEVRPPGFSPEAISGELRSAQVMRRALLGQATYETALFGLLGQLESAQISSCGQKSGQKLGLEQGRRPSPWDLADFLLRAGGPPLRPPEAEPVRKRTIRTERPSVVR